MVNFPCNKEDSGLFWVDDDDDDADSADDNDDRGNETWFCWRREDDGDNDGTKKAEVLAVAIHANNMIVTFLMVEYLFWFHK